jgi:hypothetical protein
MKKLLPFLVVFAAASSALAAGLKPSITSPTTATGQVGVPFSYTITASNGPIISYGASGLPTGLSVNTSTGLISGTPAVGTDAGSPYSVTISATNANGTGTATLTLTIKPPPPVITSSHTATGQVGVAFSYTITATNNPTSYSATGLPAGLSVNTATGVISGTPAAGTDAGSPYSVTISATNSGGTGSATLTLTINPPPPPVITSSLTATGQVGVAFSYQITATNNPTSYNATGLPSGLTVNTTTGKISGTPAVGTDAGSPYSVTISATNSGGTGSATLTLTIKPAAPVITSSLTATGQVGVAFSYTITASHSPTSYNATGLPSGLTVNTTTGKISGTPTTAGTYTVTISATNAGGTGSATLTLTINPPEPVITSSLTATGQVGVAFSYQITATNSPTFYNAAGLPTGLSVNTSTGVISGTPAAGTDAGSPYSVTISATNAGGTGSATLVLTIKPPAPPVITSALTATGQVGVAFSYQITATNNPTSYNATGLPTGLTVNTSTGLISGTPATGTDAGSPYSITISATNSGGTGSATLTLTIKPATPVITSALTATGQVGVAFSYQITATNNPTSYNATGLPTGLSVNTSTGVISGTPTTAGTYTVTISATNAGGTGSATLTLTIKPAPPVITSALTASGQVGVAFSYTITATNSPTSYNATGLPTGLSVNTSTGVISGTPTTAGTYSASISATNSGGTGSAPLTITINNAKPTITSISPTCATAGGPQFTLTVNGTNFVANSTVNWNGTALTTSFVSSTQLTAIVPATLIATAGTASITVVNPAPGGGTSTTVTFTINALPTVSSLSPTCATAGGPQFTLTVNGTNFVSGSTVNWNGTALTTSGSSTQLTATVPASLIATAGTASITVVSPCGGTSNAKTFTIVATPVITSPLTACGTRGVAFSYTITATNNPTSFTASPLPAGLTVNTSTGVISGTPTTAGTTNVTITASNGATPCNTSAQQTLVITIGTAPTISSISPTCTAAGGPQFTLTVNGPNNDFIQGDTVFWNGNPLVTTFVNSKQLTATVPASLIATAGTASITVAGCGATSGGMTFTITAVPAISSLSPTCASAGDIQFTLTVNGINFVSTSIVNWNGAALTTTFVSSTQLTATVPASLIATAGAASITVVSPCGGTSNTVTFTIDAAPSITSSLTASATVGTPFSYQITANNNPVSYNATGLPGGLTVDTTTGIISGTPTAAGTFPVTISATNNANDPCSGTATDTLQLAVTFPSGFSIAPFPGQVNAFPWGTTPPGPNDTIPFPKASTGNSFVSYWNPPGTNTNPRIVDSPTGGLQRNQDTVGMKYNPYDPTVAGAKPDPTKDVWRGNPSPPNDNTSGQFSDPRASWYITDPWPTADYVTGSYWGGPHPNLVPSNWPDSGHRFSYTGVQPTGQGQYPTDIMAGTIPTPDPTKSISLLSSSNTGILTSITELGNVWDPAQMTYTVTNPGGPLPDIPSSASPSSRGAGGHTLAIGRPEFSKFDQNGMRAWQLLDVFSARTANTNFTNTAGLVNINTASRDVLRALAAGILQNRDPATQPLYPPTSTSNPGNIQQADKFADAVINSRPLLSTAALSAIRDSQGQPFFGNPNQYNNSTQTPPSEWNDPGREELFAKIYNLATTRSRNFRVFVTGQSLDKNGNVLSTVTKVYQVFVKPTRDPTTGAILSQQVVIKYEGSM